MKQLIPIGDPRVRKRSKNISAKDINSKPILNLINNLITTMRAKKLVGIAAPQIGVNLNLFITELRKTTSRSMVKSKDEVRIFINPKIISYSSKKTLLMEGCGTLLEGQLFGPVLRPQSVTVQARNLTDNFELKATGLLAKVIQHEYDHLQGIICIDKFTDTRKIIDRQTYLNSLK